MKLTCQQCGGEAHIEGEAVVRACGHNTVGVSAHLEAVAYGVGTASGTTEDGRLTFLRRILAKIVNKLRGRD